MNNKHTCLAADDFTEAAWGRLEVGFQNWKAASFMAEIPALQVIPPSCWGNQFAKWKPGSLFPPLTNNWTSFPFSCLVMGAEEGGEGLKLQWINKLVCYWREWRGEVYSTWKCRTCRNCVANSRMSGQLRITCEPFAVTASLAQLKEVWDIVTQYFIQKPSAGASIYLSYWAS